MGSDEVGSSESDSDKQPTGRNPQEWCAYWGKEMSAAEKRQRRFVKQGNSVVSRYLGLRRGESTNSGEDPIDGTDNKLNLFYTNVSTLICMLYGSTPKIDVAREHADPGDDIARVAAVMYQRILEADVQPSGSDVPTHLKTALQDRLLPGLGVCRVRYEFDQKEEPVFNPFSAQLEQKPVIVDERAPIDYVHWQDFRWGWGRTWAELPWLAFRSYLTKDEATKRFGARKAQKLTYENQLPTGTKQADDPMADEFQSNKQKAQIWEIWDRKSKKVFWWSDGLELILDAKEDPLKLDGFWPMPRPMTANMTSTKFMPRADYVMAEDLYNEIDVLYSRITIITRAIKVVGVYDGSTGASVGRMLEEGMENDLIPVDNWAMFAEKGGLRGVIDWFPVEQVVSTLATLRQVLGESIELLYQITGMSDVLRGANTDQYTSDGTNQLKAKFGSIKIQALQDEFARFASDLEALKAEVISKHFEVNTIAKQASVNFLPQPDRQYIGPALQLMKSEDVKWRVDIRPESIAMVDYAQLKAERTEFVNSIATFLQSAGTLIKEEPGTKPMLLQILKWTMAGFKGSNTLEGLLDQAIDAAQKAPPEQKPDPKTQQMQMQMAMQAQVHQNEMEKASAKHANDMKLLAAKLNGELDKIQQANAAKMDEFMAKTRGDVTRIMADLRADLKVIAEKNTADLSQEEAQSTMAIAEKEVEHINTMEEAAQEHDYTLDEIEATANARESGE